MEEDGGIFDTWYRNDSVEPAMQLMNRNLCGKIRWSFPSEQAIHNGFGLRSGATRQALLNKLFDFRLPRRRLRWKFRASDFESIESKTYLETTWQQAIPFLAERK